MARPLKTGLDYFPIDCNMDNQMELLEAEAGLVGFAIVVKLWQWIYSDKGYYMDWGEETQLLFCKRTGADLETVSRVIEIALNREIFHQAKYDQYGILTSRGIQARYLAAVTKRKDVKIIKEYYLQNGSASKTIVLVGLMTEKTELMTEKTELMTEESTQSKVEESRGDKSINAETIIAERNFPLQVQEIVIDWVTYKSERRQGYKPTGLKSLLTQIENNITNYGTQAVIEAIRSSMASNYQGILWDRMTKAKKKSSNPFWEMLKEEANDTNGNNAAIGLPAPDVPDPNG